MEDQPKLISSFHTLLIHLGILCFKAQFPLAGFFYQEENPNFLPPVLLLKSIFYADQKPQSIGFQVFLPFG